MATNTQKHEAWLPHTTRGVSGVCPGADSRWVATVALLAAMDFEDTLAAADDDDCGPEATPEEAERWGAYYADRISEFPVEVPF